MYTMRHTMYSILQAQLPQAQHKAFAAITPAAMARSKRLYAQGVLAGEAHPCVLASAALLAWANASACAVQRVCTLPPPPACACVHACSQPACCSSCNATSDDIAPSPCILPRNNYMPPAARSGSSEPTTVTGNTMPSKADASGAGSSDPPFVGKTSGGPAEAAAHAASNKENPTMQRSPGAAVMGATGGSTCAPGMELEAAMHARGAHSARGSRSRHAASHALCSLTRPATTLGLRVHYWPCLSPAPHFHPHPQPPPPVTWQAAILLTSRCPTLVLTCLSPKTCPSWMSCEGRPCVVTG